VQVNVKDGLSGKPVAVEDGPVAALRMSVLRGNERGPSHQLTYDPVVGLIEIVQRRDVAPRDDEDMQRRLWIDVADGNDAFVLMDEGAGDVASYDLAEETIGHVILT
jgi:hypothetical protein